jgi:outer membrane lipoprotein-sorting protein
MPYMASSWELRIVAVLMALILLVLVASATYQAQTDSTTRMRLNLQAQRLDMQDTEIKDLEASKKGAEDFEDKTMRLLDMLYDRDNPKDKRK